MGLSANLIFDIRMKTYIYKSFFWLVLLVLAGCQEKEEFGKASNGNISLKASIEKTGSRTSVDEEGCVLWVNTDAIGVFGNETRNAKFQSISAGTDVLFVGKMASSQDVPTLAYYPYNEYAVLDGNTLRFDLPSEYAYTGESNAPMLGIRQPDGSFVFKHLCGLLQVTVENVPEDAKSLNIVSEGTEGQEAPYITGSVTINDVTAENATISIAKDGSRELSIGLENTSSQETCTFNIPVPLGDYPKLSVKLMMDDGTVSMDKTISDVSMTRAKMLDMPAVDVEQESGVVTITEAGTLKQLLGEDFLNITKLKIIGPINGDDVRCLHQMLGSNAFAEKGKLTSLDLSKASIVKGGSWYCKLNEDMLEEKFCYTSDNVISEYMFYNFPNLQNLVLPNNITAIRYNAFKCSSSLTSLKIPAGVTSIGSGAFSGCSSLESLNIPDGVTVIERGTFSDCSSLASLDIPDSVTSIGEYAFFGCSSLVSVNIPDGVTSIGNGTFGSCSSLISLTIPDGVTFIGKNAFYECSSLVSVNIPAGVTSIGEYAFFDCKALESIDIPNSVTSSIGYRTFSYCSSLLSVKIGNGVTLIDDQAFIGCSSMTSITIGDGVASIGDDAFNGCSSLVSVNIPDDVTSIGEYAFKGCSSLKSIDIPDAVTSIGKCTFENCSSMISVALGKDVNFIGQWAFRNCSSLQSIVIPDGVTSIIAGTFYNCSSLTSIDISDGVSSIGENAFYNCSSLQSIVIPDGVTSINKGTFYNCTSLASVKIGRGITFIDSGVFSYCSSLKSVHITDLSAWCKITFDNSSSNPLYNGAKLYVNNKELTELIIPEGIIEIKDFAFYKCGSLIKANVSTDVTSIGIYAFYDCTSLTSINISDGVSSIGNYAFRDCSSLTSVSIGDGVTSIGKEAFKGCSSLVSVNIPAGVTSIAEKTFSGCSSLSFFSIPDGVTSIGKDAFNGCSSLASVTIGKGIASIGKSAFYYCNALTKFYCYATTPPEIDNSTFYRYARREELPPAYLYVPAGCVAKYEATTWKSHFEYIEEMK